MNLPLFQARSSVITTLIISLCLISTAASAAPPKTATAKQKAAWENEWTEKVGIELEYDLDSSGPDAWDSKAHPLVFITTEGPGYGGPMVSVCHRTVSGSIYPPVKDRSRQQPVGTPAAFSLLMPEP